MAIKIKFDAAHCPEEPTFILAKKNGDKLGMIEAKSIQVNDSLNDAAEVTFVVYKYLDGKRCQLWDDIANFKLLYCPEMNMWFEATVELDESDETVKTVFGTQLGQSELSQINLYDIEINTEADIEREDYILPTILFRWNGEMDNGTNKGGITPEDVEWHKKTYKSDLAVPYGDYKEASLLHRIMEKAPHYKVVHVDDTIRRIQRTFSFSDTSIYDAMQEIAEEIHCLFVFNEDVDKDGSVQRTVSVYDLESNCRSCGYRGEFADECPKCKGHDIKYYGDDTTIFITADELAEDIQMSAETGEVKNCFKLEAGDDLMTATVRSCNPNGSDYIWYIPEHMKSDMSEKLVEGIDKYDELYAKYQNDDMALLRDGNAAISSKYDAMVSMLNDPNPNSDDGKMYYNSLIEKYKDFNSELEKITTPIKGYSSLIDAYYNTVDFELYLRSGLMPSIEISKKTAELEAAKLVQSAFPTEGVATKSIMEALSVETANNVVLTWATIIVDSRFKVRVEKGSLNTFKEGDDFRIWTGSFVVTSYSDEEDVATSGTVTVEINNNEQYYTRQRLDKALSNDDTEDVSISGLFKKELGDFKAELKKYGLNSLSSFQNSCQTCIDILIEQGVSDRKTWGDRRFCKKSGCGYIGDTKSACPKCGHDVEFAFKCPKCGYDGQPNRTCPKCGSSNIDYSADVYTQLYIPYLEKLSAINDEMKIRESEIAVICGSYDSDGTIKTYGVMNYIEDIRSYIQKTLDFQKFLDEFGEGEELWLEFCSFRREDKYSNDNYVSDGLTNAEIISDAKKFIEEAQKEIGKAAEFQHSISSSLKNLLVIDKFSPLVEHFQIGNWLRVQVDDEIYKLRLINYEIDYDSIEDISVEFSEATKAKNSITDIQEIISQASSMASSYSSVQRQAEQGEESQAQISDWVNDGLALTKMKIVDNADNQNITWDNHGILCREHMPMTDTYDDRQLKIINRGLYVTDDNWETSKAGIGNFYFWNPKAKQEEEAYGVIADTLVGNLILSEEVGVYNKDSSITLDDSGLIMTVDKTENADNISAFIIRNKIGVDAATGEDIYENVMRVDNNGDFFLNGNTVQIETPSGSSTSISGNSLSAFFVSQSNLGTMMRFDMNSGGLSIGKSTNGVVSPYNILLSNAGVIINGNGSTATLESGKISLKGNGYSLDMASNGISLSGSGHSVVLDNDSLEFKEGLNTVSSISNETLNIERAMVNQELGFGGFIWAKRNNGNMGVRWVGGA